VEQAGGVVRFANAEGHARSASTSSRCVHSRRRPREMRLALDPWEGCRLEAIAHLPEALRTAMILFNLEGFSTEEIARLAGVRPPAIDSLLVRGRELVRDDLLECLRKLT